jgi:hypothetical protein
MRLTPTDVSQFVRLEQCERFLRFRLAERAGQKFMEDYDVNPQRITPLLSLSGHEFEEGIEKAVGSHFRTVHYAAKASHALTLQHVDRVKDRPRPQACGMPQRSRWAGAGHSRSGIT